MLDAIARAERTVHLETYLLREDRTGRRFAGALRGAARRGVRVRLVVDALGSMGLSSAFLDALRWDGVGVLEYAPLRPWAFQKRDHRKLLVVDGRVGFVSSLNIADEYAPREEDGGGWRDVSVRIEGPAASDLDAEFLWIFPSGREPAGPATAPAGEARVRVLANRSFLLRRRIRQAYLRALGAAARSIDLANAYFIPDGGIVRALRSAARRGVAVRILVPELGDVPLAAYAGRRTYDRLLSGGVRIFRYAESMMHAKAAVVDGVWSAVGSYNMDHRSLVHNLETNVHVLDAGLARELSDYLEDLVAHSRELRLETWRARPGSDRLLERAAYLLRFWL